ncbi:MAG: SDR family oxidoreductase [Pyrinomonadaceae bacterium]|nr:SDR family oxidoreductase [Pyrinomonadaceae bacterium]
MPAYSQHSFSEKVALVTDGTNPVGRAVAMQLALLGCYVIVGFSELTEDEKNALEELRSLGTLANTVEIDITEATGAKKLIEEVEKLYGRLDLLINCLKFADDSPFESTNEKHFDRILEANFKSVFFVTQEALRLMKPRPNPKIVSVLSMCDSEETKNNIAFAAANQAVVGATRSLAVALPSKFRINAVAVSEKEKNQPDNDPLDPELFRAKKEIDEDDVARTIIYLLSKESIGINGQIVRVG